MTSHHRSGTVAAAVIALAAAAGCTSPPAPKASVAISGKPSPVQPAAAATYVVTVRNTGTVTVASSSLTVGLYANAQPAQILGEPLSCQATATMRICQAGPLAPGQSRAMTFYVRAPAGGTLSGRAHYIARAAQHQVAAATPTVNTPVRAASTPTASCNWEGLRAAPEYVGLTVKSAHQRAAAQGETLFAAETDGKCSTVILTANRAPYRVRIDIEGGIVYRAYRG